MAKKLMARDCSGDDWGPFYVRATDYDALAARLAEAERLLRDDIRPMLDGVRNDASTEDDDMLRGVLGLLVGKIDSVLKGAPDSAPACVCDFPPGVGPKFPRADCPVHKDEVGRYDAARMACAHEWEEVLTQSPLLGGWMCFKCGATKEGARLTPTVSGD